MQRDEPQPLTVEQARHLFAAVEGHRLAVLFHVALTLGLRLGELLGLRWVDLDWEKATLKVTQQVQTIGGKTLITSPKSETSRRILVLPPALLARLRDHRRNQQEERALLDTDWKEHGLIFASEVGTPKMPRNFERDFYRFRSAAGLSSEINFHLLRHSVATWLDELGASEAMIAAILGHSGGTVTRRYVHVRLPAMRQVIEQLEQTLLGGVDEVAMGQR
jgi:integrase